MNKSYRVVFNESSGTWTAVSETAKGRKKSTKNRAVLASVVALSAVGSHSAFAGSVDNGVITDPDSQQIVTDGDAAGGVTAPRMLGASLLGAGAGAVQLGSATADGDNSIAVGTAASTAHNDDIAIGTQAVAASNTGGRSWWWTSSIRQDGSLGNQVSSSIALGSRPCKTAARLVGDGHRDICYR